MFTVEIKHQSRLVQRYTIFILTIIALLTPAVSRAQYCDPLTPVMIVDLSGNPDSIWVSPGFNRNGNCCGSTPPDKCLEFVITLDSAANGIIFNIASGAVPPGALFYQINCGPPVQVGDLICLDGPGPHHLTFCKPGNNQNTYSITSLAQPTTYGVEYVSQACSGAFGVTGLNDSTIIWASVPPNPIYDSYLSCLSGCTDVILTPPATGLPPIISYQVCGFVYGGCFPIYFCDTFAVNMVNDLAVTISPDNHVICYGMPNIPITANVVGGLAPFRYLWNTGETTQTIIVGPGEYSVQVLDSLSCAVAMDTVVVIGVPSQIVALAGPDQVVCSTQQSAQLAGSILTATGGIWSGGTGAYSPGNTTMNALYTPSASEIAAGYVQLILTTTGNLGCPPESDTLRISLSPNPNPLITGAISFCESTTEVYSTPFTPGHTYQWSVTGGTIVSTNLNNITILWGNAGPGSVAVTETNVLLCDSTVTIPVTINPQPVPVISGPFNVCTLSQTSYSVQGTGNTYQWNVVGGSIVGPSNSNTVTISWSTSINAIISVTETNQFGCDSTVQITASVITQPVPSISGPAIGCAGQTITYTTPLVSGNTYNWNVTGGTITSSNTNSVSVYWPSATSGTVTLTEANTLTCDSTVSYSVVVGPQPAPVITGNASVCTGSTTVYTVSNIVAGDNYSWTVTGGTISGSSTGTSVQIQWSTPGLATVSVNQLNSYGCDSLVAIQVNVIPMPAPAISGSATGCAGQTITYATTLVPGHNYNWNVTGGTIMSSNTNTISVFWPTAITGTVTLTEANTLTCDSTVSLSVIVGPQPAPAITGNASVCTGTTTAYSISNVVAGDNYLWSVTGGIISGSSSGTSVQVQWLTPGLATVSVNQSNSYGCDSLVTIQVNVITMPAPSISGSANGCAGQNITYATTLVPGNTYNWNVTGGTIMSSNTNSISVFWPTAVTGTVTLTEANTLTCDSTVSLNVIVGPQPAPAITGSAAVCTGSTTLYSVANPVAGDTYNWNVTGGVISGSSTGTSIQVQWALPGLATISVNQSNSYGCDSLVAMQVNIIQMPAPSILGSIAGCAGQSITYTTAFVPGHTYNWNVTGGTITANNNNSITIYWPSATIGTVTITEANTLTCNSAISVSVVVGPQPAPAISGSASVCTGTTTTYAVVNPVAGDNYQWNVMGGTITGSANNATVQVQWSLPGLATISVNQSNSYGCDSLVSTQVNVLTMPAPIISGVVAGCEGQSLTYTTPLVTGNTYNWSVSGGTITQNNNNSIIVYWPSATTGSVTLTEANTLTCDSTITINVVVGSVPIPVIAGTNIVCTGYTTTYSVSNPVSGDSYFWSVTGGSLISQANGTSIQVTWNNPGTASVSINQSNSYGCDSTISLPITVLTMPTPSINGNASTCAGQSITYTTPLVSGNTYTWNVIGGNVTSINNNSITVYWPSYTIGTVTLTEANSLACDSTISLNIVVGPQPAPVLSGPNIACTTDQFIYNVSNPNAGNTYVWTVTGGTILGSTNGPIILVNWTQAGTQTITLTESNSYGCTATTSIDIDVRLKPAPALTGPGTNCETLRAFYSVQNFPGHSYFWTVTGGSVIGTVVSNTIEVLWTTPGQGNVGVRVVSPLGCDSLVNMPIVIYPAPNPAISGPAMLCEDDQVTLSTLYTPGSTYSWTTTNATVLGNSFGNSLNIIVSTPGAAVLTVTETTNFGCVQQASFQIQVNAKPAPVISGSSIGCVASQQYQYGTSVQPFVSYQWNVSGGQIISGAGTGTIGVQWTTPGQQVITLTATNTISGCDSTVTFNVLTGALPTPVINSPSLSGCVPVYVSFQGNVINPNYNYNWNFGDGTTASGPLPSHNYLTPGNYNVSVTATNNTGCSATTTAVINVYPNPVSQFTMIYGGDIYFTSLSTLTLNNYSSGANQYLWSFGNGDTSTAFEPLHVFDSPGTYTVSLLVTNQYGCTDITYQVIEVKAPEHLYVPNAFSPNSDGINDFFSAGNWNVTSLAVAIYNRWGQQVYNSGSPGFNWDGTMNGKPAPEGVYVYQIAAKGIHGERFDLTGTVTLVR